MSRYVDYEAALDKRLEWASWAVNTPDACLGQEHILPFYVRSLRSGETYVMSSKFADLVDYARRTVPDDLHFDYSWLPSRSGWMWIETIVRVPNLSDEANAELEKQLIPFIPFLGVHAVGWELSNEGLRLFFFCAGYVGFTCWSWLTITEKDSVTERLRSFEEKGVLASEGLPGKYKDERQMELLHEVRWFYAAMHLMSQRLAVNVSHELPRSTRRRMERCNSDLVPIVRVVTLRRLEEERPKGPASDVNWQWQWRVQGHWRNQWCPKAQAHKHMWIEDYIKGPDDKPLKPPQHTVFIAKR